MKPQGTFSLKKKGESARKQTVFCAQENKQNKRTLSDAAVENANDQKPHAGGQDALK